MVKNERRIGGLGELGELGGLIVHKGVGGRGTAIKPHRGILIPSSRAS